MKGTTKGAMRDNLRDFLHRQTASHEQQRSLLRSLCPRILITAAYQFNELYELEPRRDLALEYIAGEWPAEDRALKCLTIRPFSIAGHESEPYALMREVALHLRALMVGAESSVNSDLLRHAYIDPEDVPAWFAAADAWRAAAGTPHADGMAAAAPDWSLRKPDRFPGYTRALYEHLKTAHQSGLPRPTAKDVIQAWLENVPTGVVKVMADGIDYLGANGEAKAANLDAIRKAIARMTE